MNNEKMTLTVAELAKVLNIGRNSAYELANSKNFPALRVGERKIIIPVAGLRTWLQRQAGGGGA
jgi:excisionase family DNA binding protein